MASAHDGQEGGHMVQERRERESELETIYRNRFSGTEGYRNQVWKTLIRHWFQAYIPPEASVLDLGCGYGEFINNVQCARKFGMDLNPSTKQKLNPEVTFLAQDCSARWELADETLDVVFTSNFFEHMLSKSDLTKTIAEASRCLKFGGRLIAMGPNIKFVGGAYWDFYDHHLPLTELSVKEAFAAGGLYTEFARDRFLPYTMINAPSYPVILLRVYLALPLAWKLLGKQFLAVARKQGQS
jgi:SAM-dependent methyltransferase